MQLSRINLWARCPGDRTDRHRCRRVSRRRDRAEPGTYRVWSRPAGQASIRGEVLPYLGNSESLNLARIDMTDRELRDGSREPEKSRNHEPRRVPLSSSDRLEPPRLRERSIQSGDAPKIIERSGSLYYSFPRAIIDAW